MSHIDTRCEVCRLDSLRTALGKVRGVVSVFASGCGACGDLTVYEWRYRPGEWPGKVTVELAEYRRHGDADAQSRAARLAEENAELRRRLGEAS
jgi:hypothetical protein